MSNLKKKNMSENKEKPKIDRIGIAGVGGIGR
jgi:hypothetical protein